MRQYYSGITPVFPDPVLYSPDFSYMDKMLQRKEQQYNSGFSKLANQWAYISRPVTNPENAKVRDAFLKQAKENLKNLSTLDLSEYQNVEAAMNVFAPYQNNENLIGDQELTAFYNEQENIAEGYRNTEGGKYFNEDNLNDIRLQRSLFAQAKPTDWKSFYSGKRPYNPYYDTQDEYTKLMEKFKPSSVTTINKNGFYITTITDKSWYKEDIQRYLNGMLSEKAKNQWEIEARVRLNSNPDGVKELYLQQSKERLPAIDKELNRINVELVKAKTQEEKDALLKNKDYFTNLKKELSDNVSKIEKGDQNFIRQNLESFSKSVYINGVIDKIATANQHKDIDQKLDFDQAALTVYQQQQQNWRTKYSEDAQTYRTKLAIAADERKRKSGSGDDGDVPPIIVSDPGGTSDVNEPLNFQQLKEKASQAKTETAIKHDELVTYIKSSTNKKDLSETEFQSWVASHPNNQLVKEYVQKAHNQQAWESMGERRKEDAMRFAINQIGEENYNKLVEWNKTKQYYSPNESAPPEQIVQSRGDMYNLNRGQRLQTQFQIDKFAREQANTQTGFDGNAYNKQFDAYVKSYLAEKKDVVLNTKGPMYTKNVIGFKPRQATMAGLAGLDVDDVTSIVAVPTTNGLNISFKINESKENPYNEDKHNIIANSITTRLSGSGASVGEYNSETKIITVRNAPTLDAFMDDDVYGSIDPSYHVQVNEIVNWRGNIPGADKIIPLAVQDAGGKNRIFEIKKVTGYSPDSDFYMLLNPLDRSNLHEDVTYRNIVAPYNALAYLLNNNSDDIDLMLQTKANKNKGQ